MNRTQALDLLTKKIPSFGRKFEDADIYGPFGWLYKTDSKIPDVIPEKYLEGITVNRDGTSYTTVQNWSLDRESFREAPEGRRAKFCLCSYGSNPHLYGTLEIDGVELVSKRKNGYVSSFVSERDILCHPELAEAKMCWKFEIGRVLPQEEVKMHPGFWEGYDPGCRTMRFLDWKEALATALFVALAKIQGPLFVLFDYGYVSDANIKKNLVISVSREGEVSFFNKASIFLNQQNHA